MSAELFSPPSKALDANASPYSGAKWKFYQHGTSTPQNVYADADLSTSLGSVVTADSAGKFVPIYFDSSLSYRGVLENSDASVTLHDIDPININPLSQAAFDPDGSYLDSSVGSKLQEIRSVKDYGAIGDGTTDDTTALTAADAASGRKYTPPGIYDTTLTSTQLDGPYWGEGQIRDASNNKRAPWFCAVKAAPSSLGNHDSAETAFNGDWSKNQIAMEHRITGAATLGQPTSGYTYTPEAYPIYGYLYNESGYNHATDGNGGRTAAVFQRVSVYQTGEGDAVAYNAHVYVEGAKAGATHFLANPAGVLFNGDMLAGQDGVYLNPREISLDDGGNDVAAIGDVINMDRTDATGALSCWWGAYRVQSVGSAAINNLLSASGKINVGIDLCMTDITWGTDKAAISLKADSRVYFNNSSSNGYYTTAFNGWYMEYNTSLGGIQIVANGGSALQLTSDRIYFGKPPRILTVTASALPAASGSNTGMEYYVSDATATTRLSTLSGGGANFVKVFSNGTNWLIQ